jgi:hypothetical protein
MENENMDVQEVPETPETVEETTEETEQSPEADLEKEELRQKLEESESKRRQLIERLKKTPKPEISLSNMDVLALAKASVDAEDMDEVIEFAKFKKISVSEALKNPTLKTILNDKAEERKTAQATQTRSPRGTTKTSGEDLLRKAELSGEVPTTDEGIQAIIKARMDRRRK